MFFEIYSLVWEINRRIILKRFDSGIDTKESFKSVLFVVLFMVLFDINDFKIIYD